MVNDPTLPGVRAALVDARGLPAGEWRKFFERMSRLPELSTDQQAEIAALAERVTTLEEATESLGSILGLDSVSVVGTLGDQVVIQLEGDEEAPAASYYYGTDADGAKGWNALPQPEPSMLPIVTGEIVSGQPVFVIGPDGSLIFGPVYDG